MSVAITIQPNENLRQSLHEVIAQTRCGCGQPNCVKCNATKEAEARLAQFDDEKHIARI